MNPTTQAKPAPDPVTQPTAGDFTTAVVHLYRAQVTKAENWRRRLDNTTNWAVVTTAAAISFALGGTESERHVVILLISVLVTFFLLLEARRYQHYDIWQTRVQFLEADFFAPILWPEGTPPHPNWRELLAADLRRPEYHISFGEALGWRPRRNYVWIYLTLLGTWLVKIAIHPTPINSAGEFFSRAAVGPVPGDLMVLLGLIFVALMTAGMRKASGEIMTPREAREKIQKDSPPPDDDD